MNNATHENSIHPLTQPSPEKDGSIQSFQKESMESLESNEIKEVLNHLNQLSFSPRIASIRAVMRYAHEKNEAVH